MVQQGSKSAPKRRRAVAVEALTPAAVSAWLRQNPDFLAKNPELLFALTPPEMNQGKGVIDFQRFMVERQRRELEKLKESSHELLTASRANKAMQQSVHRAVLALLAAPTFERAIGVVVEDWASILNADVVMMGIESSPDNNLPGVKSGLTLLKPGDVDSRLGRLQDARTLSILDPADPDMFGEAAGLARSVVWLRLSVHESVPAGLLAIGAREPGRYHSWQNTELLRFLASALAVTIRAWLDLPESTTLHAR